MSIPHAKNHGQLHLVIRSWKYISKSTLSPLLVPFGAFGSTFRLIIRTHSRSVSPGAAMLSSRANLHIQLDLLVRSWKYISKRTLSPLLDASRSSPIANLHIQLDLSIRSWKYISKCTFLPPLWAQRRTSTEKLHIKLHCRFRMQIYISNLTP